TTTRSACRRPARGAPSSWCRAPTTGCAAQWPPSARRSPAGCPRSRSPGGRHRRTLRAMGEGFDYDVVVIGSGFGGSVSALRLTAFYADRQWAHVTDWAAELAPYYDQAKRMLGVVTNPFTTPSDEVMRAVADDMGVGATFRPTPVGVFFGRPGVTEDDPYFGG